MTEFFVVATPIGNLGDITFRAIEILKNCDIILCEDSRITNRLLIRYNIENKKLVLYNDNSSIDDRKNILKMLLTGSNIAFVSDAGTPLISDPGHKLIQFLRQNDIKITPIPGASSLLAAACASAIALDQFIFLGFLPNKKIQRIEELKKIPRNYSFIFFESPNRIVESLDDLFEVFGDVKISVARELTKIHEEIITKNISQIIKYFSQNQDKIRGEFVVIVEKNQDLAMISEEDLSNEIIKSLQSGISIKETAKNLAEIYNLKKNIVYQKALEIKNSIS